MTSSEDAVSEAIGGVLLIALVLIGAAIVGTYVASQPLPEKIPKVQFSVKEYGGNIYLEHEGGESLDMNKFDVVIDGGPPNSTVTSSGGSRWAMGDRLTIPGAVTGSIGLVYKGGSGETLLRSSRSEGGYHYVFPSYDPNEVINLPPPFPAPGDSDDLTWQFPSGGVPPPNYTPGEYSGLAWQFPSAGIPQPTFAPANGKHIYVAGKNSTIVPPSPPLFVCDGVNDESEINDALSIAQGGVVELLDGDFRCSGRITVPDHTTLIGQGSLVTTIETKAKPGGSGYLPISTGGEYVNICKFTMRGNAFVMVTRSHVRVNDVRATGIDLDGTLHRASGNGMFFVWVAPPVTVIDDVEFYECHVVDAHTHGFNMNQDYSDKVERATTNIRFLNCRAVRCGFGEPAGSRSEWITGFDFHEWQDLINLEVVNCIASNNWESGFHLEPGARYGSNGENIGNRTVSRNIYFRSCVSAGNGQRNTYDGHFFMSGYYLSRDTHLENCQSLINRNAGFYVHGGADSSFSSCKDTGSTYGWKICKASQDITLTDCSSSDNQKWALWLSFSQRIRVNNFHQDSVTGDRGFQNILGWYKDEPKYQQPVTDSWFDIIATNNPMPIINQAGGGNTYSLTYG